MKKILSLSLVLLIICFLGTQTALAAGAVDDPNKPPPPPAGTTTDPDSRAQAPLPFSPTERAIDVLEENISSVDIGESDWKQAVPVFDIATTGMRFVITAIFFTAGPIVLVMLVYSGIKLVVKPENEEEHARTKRTLIYSAIGMLVMAFSYAIVQNLIDLF